MFVCTFDAMNSSTSGGAVSRSVAITALESAERTWRITCNVKEVNGVLAAVRAGIGVAVFPQSLIPPDLVQVAALTDLPPLGDVDFVLLDNPGATHEPADALASAILRRPGNVAAVQPSRAAR